MLQALIVLLFCSHVHAYMVAPSLNPLKYLSMESVQQYLVENFESAVWSTILPVDQNDDIAIFILEGMSGFAGGVAIKGVSLIDGQKNNRESALQNAEISTAYFATSAAVRSLAQLAGFSTIFINILALFVGSLTSELLKFRGRSIQPKMKRVGNGPTMYELMKFKQPAMMDIMRFRRSEGEIFKPRMEMIGDVTMVELSADLTRWFFIYFLCPRGPITSAKLEDFAIVGFVAGVFAQLVRERKDREIADDTRKASQEYLKALRARRLKIESTQVPAILTKLQKLLMRGDNANEPAPEVKQLPRPPRVQKVDFVVTRFARAGVECAVQLLTYEASRRYVSEVAPYFQSIRLESVAELLQQ